MSARRVRWFLLLAALAVAGAGVRLGLWQLDRAAQKQAWHDAVVSRGALPSLTGRDLNSDPRTARDQWHRRVHLEGRWQAPHTILLDNRQMNGRPGFLVLTPLELADGRWVLVQRGWLARDPRDRTRAEVPAPSPGAVEIVGRLAPPPSRLMDFGDAGTGPIRQNLDIAAFAAEIGKPLLPVSVLQMPMGGPPDGLLRDWPRPAADVAKHHGYAFQWFALSLLALVLYAWYQFRRPSTAPA